MADTEAHAETEVVPPAPTTAKGRGRPAKPKTTKAKAAPKEKKPKAAKKPADHPKTSAMVVDAIRDLGDRGGSSLKAIKKHITDAHKVDVERLAPFIRKFLKSAVEAGTLVQVKGKGANGSFKLPTKGSTATPAKTKKVAAAVKASPKKPVATLKKQVAVKKTPPTPVKKTVTKNASVKKSSVATKRPPTPKKAVPGRRASASKKTPPAKAVAPPTPKVTPRKAFKSPGKGKKAPAKKGAQKKK